MTPSKMGQCAESQGRATDNRRVEIAGHRYLASTSAVQVVYTSYCCSVSGQVAVSNRSRPGLVVCEDCCCYWLCGPADLALENQPPPARTHRVSREPCRYLLSQLYSGHIHTLGRTRTATTANYTARIQQSSHNCV